MTVSKEESTQRRTIMGQVDYSLKFIQSLKNQLMDVGNPHAKVNWAVGGYVMVLVSGLLHQIDETVLKPEDGKFLTAEEGLNEIKKQFCEFVDLMLENVKP